MQKAPSAFFFGLRINRAWSNHFVASWFLYIVVSLKPFQGSLGHTRSTRGAHKGHPLCVHSLGTLHDPHVKSVEVHLWGLSSSDPACLLSYRLRLNSRLFATSLDDSAPATGCVKFADHSWREQWLTLNVRLIVEINLAARDLYLCICTFAFGLSLSLACTSTSMHFVALLIYSEMTIIIRSFNHRLNHILPVEIAFCSTTHRLFVFLTTF